jgi:hypothetical protein
MTVLMNPIFPQMNLGNISPEYRSNLAMMVETSKTKQRQFNVWQSVSLLRYLTH